MNRGAPTVRHYVLTSAPQAAVAEFIAKQKTPQKTLLAREVLVFVARRAKTGTLGIADTVIVSAVRKKLRNKVTEKDVLLMLDELRGRLLKSTARKQY